jgi:competence protein ComEA
MGPALVAAVLVAAVLAPGGATAQNAAVPNPAAQMGAAPSAGASRKKPGKAPLTGVLNVNRATEAELRLLPGIGKKRAELIVARRQKRPFASVDEVGRIKGMRAVVQRLRSKLTVQGDTTLRPVRP